MYFDAIVPPFIYQHLLLICTDAVRKFVEDIDKYSVLLPCRFYLCIGNLRNQFRSSQPVMFCITQRDDNIVISISSKIKRSQSGSIHSFFDTDIDKFQIRIMFLLRIKFQRRHICSCLCRKYLLLISCRILRSHGDIQFRIQCLTGPECRLKRLISGPSGSKYQNITLLLVFSSFRIFADWFFI